MGKTLHPLLPLPGGLHGPQRLPSPPPARGGLGAWTRGGGRCGCKTVRPTGFSCMGQRRHQLGCAISPLYRELHASCPLVPPVVLSGWCRVHARAVRTQRPRGLRQGHLSSRPNCPAADLQVLGVLGTLYRLPPSATCVEALWGPVPSPQVHGLPSAGPASLCSSCSCWAALTPHTSQLPRTWAVPGEVRFQILFRALP